MINTCPIYGACRVAITSGSPTEICGLHGLTKHKGLRPKHGGAQSTKDWRMLKGIDQNIDQNDSKWPALRFEIFASMFSNVKVVHPSQKRSRVYDPFVSICLFGIAIKKTVQELRVCRGPAPDMTPPGGSTDAKSGEQLQNWLHPSASSVQGQPRLQGQLINGLVPQVAVGTVVQHSYETWPIYVYD